MARVVHFEIHADEPARAVEFYRNVFDWKIEPWGGVEDYYLATTGPDAMPGINGGIMKRRVPILGETIMAYICTIDVTDETLDVTLEKVEAHGGGIIVAKTTIPQVGHLAYCSDTEGNVFGLMHADQNA